MKTEVTEAKVNCFVSAGNSPTTRKVRVVHNRFFRGNQTIAIVDVSQVDASDFQPENPEEVAGTVVMEIVQETEGPQMRHVRFIGADIHEGVTDSIWLPAHMVAKVPLGEVVTHHDYGLLGPGSLYITECGAHVEVDHQYCHRCGKRLIFNFSQGDRPSLFSG